MTAVDRSPDAKKLDHLRHLEIRKQVEHGEIDVLIGSDYYEELLLLIEHRIRKPGEPVDTTRMDNCWTCLRNSKRVQYC